MSYLIMRRGPEQGKLFRLDTPEVTIGRGSKNDIVIHDNEVSREHLRLVRADDNYELHDKSSSNGTFVNGHPVEGVWVLQSQCIIELGDSITLEYYNGEPTEEHLADSNTSIPPVVLPSATPYLVVMVRSNMEPQVYPLEGVALTVGRATNNDIVIVEPEMSREHFRLTMSGRGYTIEDLNSTNGTMVNGELLSAPQLLQADDIIQVGTMVQIQYTTKPEKFVSEMKTDVLADARRMPTDEESGKRKTSPAEIPEILKNVALKATQIVPEPESDLENKVLITYAREDWESIVDSLVDNLNSADIETWVEQKLTAGEDEWRLAVEQARLECWMLVVVVSKKAMASDNVKRTLRHFMNREKPIILFMVESVENLPLGSENLTKIHYNPGLPSVAYLQLGVEIKRLQK